MHWDALRFRPDPRINDVIRRVAADSGPSVSLLDPAIELGSDPASTGPISGREILFEHVHFDWNGNYRLARMMARGCAAAIFGGDPGDSGWLDSTGCAVSLAYTPHERLPMLLRIDVLVRKPPFTNQITHVEDEARMTREIDEASREAKDPVVAAQAAVVAADASAKDPGNPALLAILEGIDLGRGELDSALGYAKRAADLVPRDFATIADEASILMRLGRFDEAARILDPEVLSSSDLENLAPVLSEYWIRTKRFGEGERLLERAIARAPRDFRLQVVRAGLTRAAGDNAAAEREYRSILTGDPANSEALEGLVAILMESGRDAEAATLSQASAESQPRNQENSLRAVKACDAKNDVEGSVRNLLAAELSGPVDATFELTLALKLYQLHRADEMMTHLAEARKLSTFEGNPRVTESIDQLISRMARETAAP
jgi:tetratricopeptide (TPR) repeat protein